MSEVQLNHGGEELSPLVCVYKQVDHLSVDDFRKIYSDHYKIVFTIAYKFLKDKFLAEDAIQEVFLKLWKCKDEIDIHRNLRSYIVTITRNYLLNMLRNTKAELEKRIASASAASEKNESDTDFSVGWKLHLTEFQQCLRNMSPRKREIFSMKILEGFSNEEIAYSLGISVNTVKFQYSDAKSIIERHLRMKEK